MADEDKGTGVADPIVDPADEGGEAGGEENNENYGGFDPDSPMVKMASGHGWKPKDQLDDPSKGIGPDEFIENQWKINEATKNGKKRVEHTLEQMTRQFTQLNRRFDEMSQKDQTKAQGELRELKRQAVEEGDNDKVDAIDDQIAKINESAVQPQDEPSLDPAISDWMQENSWYKPEGAGADSDVSDVIELAEELNSLDEYKVLSPRFRLAKIDREIANYVEMRRPDLIGKYAFNGIKPTKTADGKSAPKAEEDESKSARKEISDVEGNVGRGGNRSKATTYASLSAEEKRACDSQVDSIPNFTRKEWLANFDEIKDRG